MKKQTRKNVREITLKTLATAIIAILMLSIVGSTTFVRATEDLTNETVLTGDTNENTVDENDGEEEPVIDNYEVSSPLTYTSTLDEAVKVADDGATIKLLRDCIDSSEVSIENEEHCSGRILTIDIQSYTLTRTKPIMILWDSTVTFEGSGAIIMTEGAKGTYLIDVRYGSHLIKNGTALWSAEYGVLNVIDDSYYELNGGFLSSSKYRVINEYYAYPSRINNTNIYTNAVSDFAIRVEEMDIRTNGGMQASGLVITGSSKVGNGTWHEKEDTRRCPVISFSSGNRLTLSGDATVYASEISRGAIGCGNLGTVYITGNASIYCNSYSGTNSYDEACVWLDHGATVIVNTKGNIYTRGNLCFMWGTKKTEVEGTIIYKHGNLLSRRTNQMYIKNGQIKTIEGVSKIALGEFKKMTGYNSLARGTFKGCYKVSR